MKEHQRFEEKMMRYFDTLEDYKRPATIVSFPIIIDGEAHHDFPISVGGKVDFKCLPSPDEIIAKKERDCVSTTIGLSDTIDDTSVEDCLSANITNTIIKTVREILDIDHLDSSDDFFKTGLTSMEVPTLKFMLKVELELLNEISTDSIFQNPTAEKLTYHIVNPQDADTCEQLCDRDFIHAKYLKDKPLSGALVWFLSVFTALFAYATSLCFVFFLVLISFEALHEYGKCDKAIGMDLQNNCEDPDKWRAFWMIALSLPLIIPSCVFIGLLGVVVMKWLVIGKISPGCYSVDGLYYFRWLYVHHLEVFAIRWLLPTISMRCTCWFNMWLRMMGADIGSGAVIDTLDIHEMDCITIGAGANIQCDAMISGHTFVTVKSGVGEADVENENAGRYNGKALLIGKCWIKEGAIIGPYAMVHPPLPHPTKNNVHGTCTVVEGVLPGYQSTSRLAQTVQFDKTDGDAQNSKRSLVWTPEISFLGQVQGLLTVIVLQSVAFSSILWVMFLLFVPAEAQVSDWLGRCYLFFSPWPMGVPYAILVCFYKNQFVGKFKAGEQSSSSLDKQRWILRCLLHSRIQVAFEVAGASTEILNTFYRAMGMKIGWNSQVMPLNMVEFDLFSIGDNCSFGGQVMVFCRDNEGIQETCAIGNNSAITNSAGMLAGSRIGDNCLVGNLTLLPPGFSVPDDSKCVGTKYRGGIFCDPMVFSNSKEVRKTTKFKSNAIAFAHVFGAITFDLVYVFEFFMIAEIMTACQATNPGKIGQMHLVHNAWKVHGGYLITLTIVFAATLVSTLTIILVKRSTPRFLGKHERDSFLFVIFIWLTKVRIGSYHVFDNPSKNAF